MKYIALLRGINVGKEKRIDMKDLKRTFVSLNFENVSTYINSGNIFFETEEKQKDLDIQVKERIKTEYGLDIPTLIKTEEEIKHIANTIPDEWQNNSEEKTDVAYLFSEIDSEEILNELPFKKEYIEIGYVKGALIWNVKRMNYNKSHLNKIIGHRLYQFMTVRNVNTARYLAGKKK